MRIQALGVWGIVIFGFVYVLAVVVLAPASALTIAAGLLFGAWGFPLVIVAATSGAVLAFLAARYLARRKIEQMVSERPRLRAIDKAVGEEGWKIVGLLRLSPLVPFNLQNYFFGITDIGVVPYAAATFVGIIPGTILYIYIGTLGKTAASGHGGSGVQWAFFALGLVATGMVAFIIAHKARTKLQGIGLVEAASERRC